ncbi:MAG: glycosyltransferase, partial [Actinomycetota bacterium]
MAPVVRVVVVNFDGDQVTLRCLDALLASNHPLECLQIVVVDNASIDGLNWVLPERYPQVRLIQSDTNEGFARGCNLGLRDLDGVDYVALINNDAIVEPDWLQHLLAGFVDSTVGAVCPKLLLNVHAHVVDFAPATTTALGHRRTVGVRVGSLMVDGLALGDEARYDERFHDPEDDQRLRSLGRWTKGNASVWWPVAQDAPPQDVTMVVDAPARVTVTIGDPGAGEATEVGPEPTAVRCRVSRTWRIVNSAGGALYSGWFGGDRGFLEPDVGQYDEPAEVFSWCGGAVLLRRDYLDEVGLFDPTFFLYYEDFDLSCRGRSLGWTYRYEPASIVYHEHAYSSKAGSDFFSFWVDRNRRLVLVKHAPAAVAARA